MKLHPLLPTGALAPAALVLLSSFHAPQGQDAPSVDDTRATLGKWIETQQIISKEQTDWQQGKEVLQARVELVEKEIAALQEKLRQGETSAAEAERKRSELAAENELLVAQGARLAQAATALEADLRRIAKSLPEPVLAKLAPLFERIPEDAATAHVTPAERFQNVLVILGEINKANTEISVSYEVRDLEGGQRAEVKAVYVGLAQAYYVSASGAAGIGRPAAEGWTWEPSKTVGSELLTALEILQGKHTPAFVPLPVKIQ